MEHKYLNSIPVIFVLMILAFPIRGAAQTQISSNEDVILRKCLLKLNESQLLDTLHTDIYPTGNLARHYRYELIQTLLRHKIKVSETTQHVSNLDFEVTTGNTYNKLADGKFKRNIRGNMTVTLIDTMNNIEGMVRFPFATIDTVSVGNIFELTSNWKPSQFVTSKQHKKNRIWDRVVQPGLLISAIGITVYLLFNVRSH